MLHQIQRMLAALPAKVMSALMLVVFVPAGAGAAEQAAPPTGAPHAAESAPSVGKPPADAAMPTQPAAAGTIDAQYVIGPGDVIQIFVWRSPELSVTVPVRPDGKVSSPLVEDIIAVGKTATQLARDIEVRLAEYVRTPQVSVIITVPANALNQIKVIGQVKSPRSLAYRTGMTALDAILETGGLTEFAAGNRAVLVRREADGKETRVKLRLNDLVKKGRITANAALQPGDVLIIPESVF